MELIFVKVQGEDHLEKQRTNENAVMPVVQHAKRMTKEKYEEIQNYRVRKCQTIEELHSLHEKPVMTLRANYPGEDKNNEITRLVNREIAKTFDEIFHTKIMAVENFDTPEGPTTFYVVKGDARTLKENAIYIEQNHELGRFVDIDVYDIDEEYAVTRVELAYEPRKCFLCDEPAKDCSRNKTHKTQDLVDYMVLQVHNYLDKR